MRKSATSRAPFILVLCSLVLIAGPLRLEAAGVLRPGETLNLTTGEDPVSADGTGEDCDAYSVGTCSTDPTGDRFGARTTAISSFSRGKASVFQYYEFDVDGGDGFDTPLLSQISGKAKLNGFIALVGGGSAKGSLTLKVIDLGPTTAQNPGKVIHKETLASHELTGVVITGLNFGVAVQGGAPYVGAGAGPEFKFNVQLQKEVVRDGIDFGAHVLLIRGHSYRLQFELNALAKKGATNGLSIAQFKLGGGPVPDMLGTENWLDAINDTITSDMPNLRPERMDIKKGDSFFDPRRRLDGASDFLDSNEFLDQKAAGANLPKSFLEIVQQRFRQRTPNVLEEGIPEPGVEISELFVTLETDQVELLEEVIRLLKTPPGRRPGFPIRWKGGS